MRALCVGGPIDGRWYDLRDGEKLLRRSGADASTSREMEESVRIYHTIYTLRRHPLGHEPLESLNILAPDGMSDREAVIQLFQGYRVPRDL